MTEVHIGSIYATTWTSEEGAESTSATIDFRGRDDATALWIVWGRAEADEVVREARRQWETHPRPPEVGYEFAGKTVRAVERIWPPVSDSDS